MSFFASKNKNHSSFTISENTVLTEIITECLISLPFHPVKDRGRSHPPVKKVQALWDTGASNCCITKKLADSLGLLPVGKATVHHGNGCDVKNVYLVNIILPNKIGVIHQTVTECESTAGKFDLILGMSVITRGDFAITNKDNKTVVSFRMPSLSTIDFNNEVAPPLAKEKKPDLPSNAYAGVSRNDLCPCGSKLKYKRCHGGVGK